MAEKPTKEERAGKGPRVDMDQIADRMQASLAAGAPPPPADTTQPVHTEEEDEPAMTNDNASIIEQVNNRGEGMSQVRERPSALATSTNPIEELVDSQTSHVLAELTRLSVEVQMLIDDIKESRAEAVKQATEHARRTSLGAKAASTITEHLARVRAEFAPEA
jgi:hypothetical protein